MPNMTFSAAADVETPTRVRVKTGHFEFVVDKPEALGGTDLGPNPMDYLMGALAGCYGSALRTVAQDMDLPINKLMLRISATLDTDGMTGRNPKVRAGLSRVVVHVNVDTSADDATIDRWLEASIRRCPVGDTLANGTELKIQR